jgi:hypothetical protein
VGDCANIFGVRSVTLAQKNELVLHTTADWMDSLFNGDHSNCPLPQTAGPVPKTKALLVEHVEFHLIAGLLATSGHWQMASRGSGSSSMTVAHGMCRMITVNYVWKRLVPP